MEQRQKDMEIIQYNKDQSRGTEKTQHCHSLGHSTSEDLENRGDIEQG